MSSVYRNAYATIAAASASDSQGGCFNKRETWLPPLASNPPELAYGSPSPNAGRWIRAREATDFPDVAAVYSQSPLSQRAWVLQEMILSPRVLFFANDQVYCMCAERVVSEDSFYDEPNTVIRRPIAIEAGLHGNKEDHERFGKGINIPVTFIDMWWELVQDYSRRQLTFEQDKFSALAGLADLFQQKMPDNMLAAGLWTSDFRDGLLWQPARHPQTTERIGGIPTWSWASFRGPVVFPCLLMPISQMPDSNGAVFSTPKVIWSGRPGISHIVSGSVLARGLRRTAAFTIVPAAVRRGDGRGYPWKTDAPVYDLFLQLASGADQFIGGAVFDEAEGPESEETLTLLEISCGTTWHDFLFPKFHNVLLVWPTARPDHVEYRRAGVGLVDFECGFFNDCQQATIELV